MPGTEIATGVDSVLLDPSADVRAEVCHGFLGG